MAVGLKKGVKLSGNEPLRGGWLLRLHSSSTWRERRRTWDGG